MDGIKAIFGAVIEYFVDSSRRHKRIMHFSSMSIAYNAALALGKVAMGLMSGSLFLCISSLYNTGICLAKAVAVRGYVNSRKLRGRSRLDAFAKSEDRCYCLIGLIMLFTSLVYVASCIRELVGNVGGMKYSPLMVVAIIVVTLVEFIVSIYGTIYARKNGESILEAIKLTSIVSAMVSLVLMIRAILSYFGLGTDIYDAIGIFFGSLSSVIGAYMVIHIYRIMRAKRGFSVSVGADEDGEAFADSDGAEDYFDQGSAEEPV